MKLEDRIVLFSELGVRLKEQLANNMLESVLAAAKARNAWFTTDNIASALASVIDNFLNPTALQAFARRYSAEDFAPRTPRNIGIVAAGNIPLVGLQDLIHVVLSGNIAIMKPSSQDEILLQYMAKALSAIDPRIDNFLKLADKLVGMDAYIATGSENTARYFEYYFGTKPNIIRRSRVSVAVLDGKESRTQLSNLGNDIFTYFGLGCRNVSKLYVPKGYQFDAFFESIEYWNSITLHSKYVNNYDYNKSIMLVNGDQHYDNGFLLLKPSEELHSPISTLFYEEYEDLSKTFFNIHQQRDKIQCIVTEAEAGYVGFGRSQSPELWDYADGIDTLRFLADLDKPVQRRS